MRKGGGAGLGGASCASTYTAIILNFNANGKEYTQLLVTNTSGFARP